MTKQNPNKIISSVLFAVLFVIQLLCFRPLITSGVADTPLYLFIELAYTIFFAYSAVKVLDSDFDTCCKAKKKLLVVSGVYFVINAAFFSAASSMMVYLQYGFTQAYPQSLTFAYVGFALRLALLAVAVYFAFAEKKEKPQLQKEAEQTDEPAAE